MNWSSSTTTTWRWLTAFATGIILWFLAVAISGNITLRFTGTPEKLVGTALALLGIVRLLMLLPALYLTLRIVNKRFADMGFALTRGWKMDVAIGAAIGILWPLLQFLAMIPLTGGANREDVLASRALIGDDMRGLVGTLILAWTWAAFGEELLFRGHIIFILRGALGNRRWAMITAVAVSVLLFALTHAYQGVIGILDVGTFGLIMAVLYVRRNSLVAPIIAHGVNDTLLFIGLYLFF